MARGAHMPAWQELRPHVAGACSSHSARDMPLSAWHARPAMAMDDASAASHSIFIYPAVCSMALYALNRNSPVRDSVRIACICFFIGSPFYVKERHVPFLFFACHWPISSSMSFSRVRPASMSSSRSSTSPLIRSVSTTTRALTFFILPLE